MEKSKDKEAEREKKRKHSHSSKPSGLDGARNQTWGDLISGAASSSNTVIPPFFLIDTFLNPGVHAGRAVAPDLLSDAGKETVNNLDLESIWKCFSEFQIRAMMMLQRLALELTLEMRKVQNEYSISQQALADNEEIRLNIVETNKALEVDVIQYKEHYHIAENRLQATERALRAKEEELEAWRVKSVGLEEALRAKFVEMEEALVAERQKADVEMKAFADKCSAKWLLNTSRVLTMPFASTIVSAKCLLMSISILPEIFSEVGFYHIMMWMMI